MCTSINILNLTISKLRLIGKGRNTDGYQNMSKKTHTHTKQLENLLTKITLLLPSDATEKMMKLFKTNVDKNMLKDYKPKKNWWHF